MTTTVTTATTAATSAIAGWAVALGAGGVLLVIGLLIAMELLGTSSQPWQQSLRRVLRIATAPLAVVFLVGVVVKMSLILEN